MAEDQTITIEVDGKSLEAMPGQMLIEVTDAAGISVPRFCYHKHLSVAANCRMCLVEVEKAPKPLPACATPVVGGMKVFTRSPLAREAQKGTMEFLLINHPLDCPICDQGGECELQDVAMGYGADVSRYSERKRVVRDEDIGALIATEMTRCIHCTRCVRFGGEIAGLRELGATGRGEHMRIGVYLEHSVASELSGNVIDLCPVGALTAKPSRFTSRAWELTEHDTVAAHDGVGSNLHVHVRRNQVMRVVPRENEAFNQTWISDRDRFSYQGLYAPDRLQRPMLRDGGKLKEVDWQQALQAAAKLLKAQAGDQIGALVSPSATLEEFYLMARLVRGLGSDNIDHRLRQSDFSGTAADPALPWLGQPIASLAGNDATLLVGAWLRKDQPMLNHRVRQSHREGGQVMAINPVAYDYNFDLDVDIVCTPSAMAAELAGVAAALGVDTHGVPVDADQAHQAIADALKAAGQGSVLLGTAAMMHPDFALLRALAVGIADAAGVSAGVVGFGSNDCGAWMAGAVPHRVAGGAAVTAPGLDAQAMLTEPRALYVTLGIEPDADTADPARTSAALREAQLIALSSHRSPWLEEHADILLPVAAFAETSGTFVNIEGVAQSFSGAAQAPGETRPAWKVLRVLGNLVDIDGFDYADSRAVRDEVVAACADLRPDNRLAAARVAARPRSAADGQWQRIGGVSIYGVDALTRRAHALQSTPDAWGASLRINADAASALGVNGNATVRVSQAGGSAEFAAVIDDSVPDGCVWLPAAVPGAEALGPAFGPVAVEKV
ncbi:MAG: NADH-quinone oxidoreductase subunit NuoG [Gammaproteobacteria bacterium]|nr:NADH-quinone oxidoreductase subunit NuoG [Gammaproteobacteria bacterium]